MKRFLPTALVILGLSVAACDGAPVASSLNVEIAMCNSPVGGPFELPAATAVEAVPGYDQALAKADLLTLPEALEMQYVGPLERSLIAYMLERRHDELEETLSRDDLMQSGPMGQAVLYAFYVAQEKDWLGADTHTLRRGLQRFYACVRGVPLTLEGFKKAVMDPTTLAAHEIQSNAKNETRRLRGDDTTGVWMAETIVEGQVRETEIILAGHRRDGALDFLAYDENGRLMDRSRFETPDGTDISGAAPYVCVVCHSNQPDFVPNVVYPTLSF